MSSEVVSSSYPACIAALKPHGRYLAGNPRVSTMLRAPITTRTTDKTASCAFADETPAMLQGLVEMAERGALRSIVDTVYPLSAAATAHQRVEQEQRTGAIVLSLE